MAIKAKCGGLCGRFYDTITRRDVENDSIRYLFMLAGFQLLEQAAYLYMKWFPSAMAVNAMVLPWILCRIVAEVRA